MLDPASRNTLNLTRKSSRFQTASTATVKPRTETPKKRYNRNADQYLPLGDIITRRMAKDLMPFPKGMGGMMDYTFLHNQLEIHNRQGEIIKRQNDLEEKIAQMDKKLDKLINLLETKKRHNTSTLFVRV